MINCQLNFHIDPELIELYKQSTHDPFLMPLTGPKSYDECELDMNTYSSLHAHAGFQRLGIWKIYLGDRLVGYSFPRELGPNDYKKYNILSTKRYYRMGQIYVLPDFRGRGIATEAARQFIQRYPNIVWSHQKMNIASQRVAEHLGLRQTALLYIDHDLKWHHVPIDDPKIISIGWASGIDDVQLTEPHADGDETRSLLKSIG